jgi:hypothetical protein
MQSENETFTVKTYDAFLGYTNDDKGVKTTAANVEKVNEKQPHKVDLVIFDEIFLCPVRTLHKIKCFVDSHPNISCICTGDTNQNKPVSFPYNNIKDHKKYLSDCVSKIFPNIILLERAKTSKETRTTRTT